MGQARIRKRNRTHRENFTVWYPEADDLSLLHVPENIQSDVRKRIQPWLTRLSHTGYGERLGVLTGECWRVARAFVITSKDPKVRYVEGVWAHPLQIEKGEQPLPHAWATVDSHIVDLIAEFGLWRVEAMNEERKYEPLKEYSYEELTAVLEIRGYDRNFRITATDWPLEENMIFKSAADRLIERYRKPQAV